MQKDIVGLLLAAGCSSRFGSDKLCYSLPEQDAIAVRACRNLQQGVDTVVAVIRPDADELAGLLVSTGAFVVVCPHAADGMGTSLAYGVNQSSQAYAWLIALADMPLIQPKTILTVANTMRSGALLAAPFYSGKRGHPVGFSCNLGEELRTLTGDSGAKAILDKYYNQLVHLTCEDAGILYDIDSPSDIMM